MARRFAGYLERGLSDATEFLQRVPVNYEILYFTVCLLRRSRDPRAINTLRELIQQSKAGQDPQGLGGKALTVLLRVTPALPRDLDYRSRNFDYADLEEGNVSGLDFSGSTFKGANFANANIEGASLSDCDLTDVRLHETTSVLALVASSNRIFASYEDGTIWERDVGGGGKPSSRIVFSQHGLRLSRIGMTKHGIPWGIAGREALLFDISVAEWTCMARIPLPQKCADFNAGDEDVALLLSDQDARCLLAALEQQTFSMDVPMPESTAFLSPMTGTLCVRSGSDSVKLVSSDLDCQIAAGNTTCLHAVSRPGEILIAAGESDGIVRVFSVNSGTRDVRQVFQEAVHAGPVLSVMFSENDMVASGGVDRTIALTPLGGTPGLTRNLQLSLRCKGLNTTGLQPESQRKRLDELKARELQ